MLREGKGGRRRFANTRSGRRQLESRPSATTSPQIDRLGKSFNILISNLFALSSFYVVSWSTLLILAVLGAAACAAVLVLVVCCARRAAARAAGGGGSRKKHIFGVRAKHGIGSGGVHGASSAGVGAGTAGSGAASGYHHYKVNYSLRRRAARGTVQFSFSRRF